MNPSSVLLRLLLIVVLVLNGAGTAAASVAMLQVAMPAIASAQAQTKQLASTMPCHGMAQAVTLDTAASMASIPAVHDGAKPTVPDCCTSGTCQCACVQIAQATPPAALVPAFASPRSALAQAMPASHVDPALPHAIRPPIG